MGDKLRDHHGMVCEKSIDQFHDDVRKLHEEIHRWRTADPGGFLGGGIPPDQTSQYRIEALRAASRIVAGMYSSGEQPSPDGLSPVAAENATTFLAEQFAEWLETGER